MSQLQEEKCDVEDLKKAGLSESEIRSLDQTDLRDLFPGVQNVKDRHDLFKEIHQEQSAGSTSKTESEGGTMSLLQEKKCDVEDLKKAGLSDSAIRSLDQTDLWDLFPGVQNVKDRHDLSVKIPQEQSAGSTNRTEPEGGTMSLLQEEKCDVEDLKKAGLSESEIRSLDQTDLRDLFPGVQNVKDRHDLFVKIHQEQSAGSTSKTEPEEVLKEIRRSYPDAASVLEQTGYRDYLEVLDRADLLDLFPGVEKLKQRKEIFKIIHPQSSAVASQSSESVFDKIMKPFKGFGLSPNSKKVRYQILDKDKSPKVSKQVIRKVTSKTGVSFNETTEDHKVSILFCPVISRIGSDAEVAIASIKDDKPVILVFLIHSLKPLSISLLKPWDDEKNIVMYKYIFHHETKSGLLSCTENSNAFSEIEEKLLEYSEEIK